MTLDWQRAAEVAQSITAQGTPFSADSVVRFASVTKHLFASLVTGPLADVIALDDQLVQHLPQLRGPSGQATVGQALDMTAGLHDLPETLSLLGLSVYHATQSDDLLAFVAALDKLNYPAGSEISYSNPGY